MAKLEVDGTTGDEAAGRIPASEVGRPGRNGSVARDDGLGVGGRAGADLNKRGRFSKCPDDS